MDLAKQIEAILFWKGEPVKLKKLADMFSVSLEEVNEGVKNLDACRALHAEQNALLQCPDVFKIHSAYVTASPCITCTKLLLNTSCKNVYYYNEYPHQEARELWESSGRLWIKTEL